MGIDRIVTWKNRGPDRAELRLVLEDYLGGAMHEVEDDGSRLYAHLIGKPSFPFKRIPGHEDMTEVSEQHDKRWFEVYLEPTYIDVITRQTDEYTNVVAEGFVVLAARFWKGKRSPH